MTRRLWWVAPLALVLAWLVSLTPPAQRAARALLDAQLRLTWTDATRTDVAVVEVDDASLRALRSQAGPWQRDTPARIADYLLELGATQVVLDLPSARSGGDDAQPAPGAAHGAGIVLAARAPRDGAAPDTLQPLGRQLPAHWPRTSRAAVVWPAEAQFAAIGVVVAPDDDGGLQRWPLLVEVQERGLPSLPLAALQSLAPDASLRYGDRRYQLGTHRWAVDAHGRVAMKLPARDTIASTSFLRVGAAALGVTKDPSLRERFAGRIVFVGRGTADAGSRLPDARTLAAATSALAAGEVLGHPSRVLDAALIVLALLPAVALARRGRLDGPLDTLQALAAAGAVWMASTLAMALWRVPGQTMGALLVVAAGWVLALGANWIGAHAPADKGKPANAGFQF